jgi:hypothetical protein
MDGWHKKWAEANPKQAACDHGIIFDEDEYKESKSMTAAEVQKRWPRGWGLCPKGCGYNGIAYASYMHYIAGDW